ESIMSKLRHFRKDSGTPRNQAINIQHPTSNIEHRTRLDAIASLGVGCWMFGVGCFAAVQFRPCRTEYKRPLKLYSKSWWHLAACSRYEKILVGSRMSRRRVRRCVDHRVERRRDLQQSGGTFPGGGQTMGASPKRLSAP